MPRGIAVRHLAVLLRPTPGKKTDAISASPSHLDQHVVVPSPRPLSAGPRSSPKRAPTLTDVRVSQMSVVSQLVEEADKRKGIATTQPLHGTPDRKVAVARPTVSSQCCRVTNPR